MCHYQRVKLFYYNRMNYTGLNSWWYIFPLSARLQVIVSAVLLEIRLVLLDLPNFFLVGKSMR